MESSIGFEKRSTAFNTMLGLCTYLVKVVKRAMDHEGPEGWSTPWAGIDKGDFVFKDVLDGTLAIPSVRLRHPLHTDNLMGNETD